MLKFLAIDVFCHRVKAVFFHKPHFLARCLEADDNIGQHTAILIDIILACYAVFDFLHLIVPGYLIRFIIGIEISGAV